MHAYPSASFVGASITPGPRGNAAAFSMTTETRVLRNRLDASERPRAGLPCRMTSSTGSLNAVTLRGHPREGRDASKLQRMQDTVAHQALMERQKALQRAAHASIYGGSGGPGGASMRVPTWRVDYTPDASRCSTGRSDAQSGGALGRSSSTPALAPRPMRSGPLHCAGPENASLPAGAAGYGKYNSGVSFGTLSDG
mmetsp:Transcript_21363/g.54591  ORF Transcript_21363/g.54591 Transcript_21363/m.54591 type:complete len:197 (+) Transcript_21363:86-676(+)